mmetsp:Transcript_21957/g.40082  ORF Transcript_21957/g.40082 Transcript_21957/m.40082 type:complete len:171 (-) Transcript_21957:1172-1684(-)
MEPLKEVKIVLCGAVNVGKTSIRHRLISDDFIHDASSEIGFVVNKTVKAGNIDLKLNIWDLSGNIMFRPLSVMYLSDTHGVVFVFDITSRESLEELASWLGILGNAGKAAVPKVLIGNKTDLEAKRKVSFEEALKYAEANHMTYIETSALLSSNIELAFLTLGLAIVSQE